MWSRTRTRVFSATIDPDFLEFRNTYGIAVQAYATMTLAGSSGRAIPAFSLGVFDEDENMLCVAANRPNGLTGFAIPALTIGDHILTVRKIGLTGNSQGLAARHSGMPAGDLRDR